MTKSKFTEHYVAASEEDAASEKAVEIIKEQDEQIIEEIAEPILEPVVKKPRGRPKKEPVTEDKETKAMLKLLLEERKDMTKLITKLSTTVTKLAESVSKLEKKKFEIPQPIVNVTLPETKMRRRIIRDENGDMTEVIDERIAEDDE